MGCEPKRKYANRKAPAYEAKDCLGEVALGQNSDKKFISKKKNGKIRWLTAKTKAEKAKPVTKHRPNFEKKTASNTKKPATPKKKQQQKKVRKSTGVRASVTKNGSTVTESTVGLSAELKGIMILKEKMDKMFREFIESLLSVGVDKDLVRTAIDPAAITKRAKELEAEGEKAASLTCSTKKTCMKEGARVLAKMAENTVKSAEDNMFTTPDVAVTLSTITDVASSSVAAKALATRTAGAIAEEVRSDAKKAASIKNKKVIPSHPEKVVNRTVLGPMGDPFISRVGVDGIAEFNMIDSTSAVDAAVLETMQVVASAEKPAKPSKMAEKFVKNAQPLGGVPSCLERASGRYSKTKEHPHYDPKDCPRMTVLGSNKGAYYTSTYDEETKRWKWVQSDVEVPASNPPAFIGTVDADTSGVALPAGVAPVAPAAVAAPGSATAPVKVKDASELKGKHIRLEDASKIALSPKPKPVVAPAAAGEAAVVVGTAEYTGVNFTLGMSSKLKASVVAQGPMVNLEVTGLPREVLNVAWGRVGENEKKHILASDGNAIAQFVKGVVEADRLVATYQMIKPYRLSEASRVNLSEKLAALLKSKN